MSLGGEWRDPRSAEGEDRGSSDSDSFQKAGSHVNLACVEGVGLSYLLVDSGVPPSSIGSNEWFFLRLVVCLEESRAASEDFLSAQISQCCHSFSQG